MNKTEKFLIEERGFKKIKYMFGDEFWLQKKLKHPFIKNIIIIYEESRLCIYGGIAEQSDLYECKYSKKKLDEILKTFNYEN